MAYNKEPPGTLAVLTTHNLVEFAVLPSFPQLLPTHTIRTD